MSSEILAELKRIADALERANELKIIEMGGNKTVKNLQDLQN